MKMYVRLIPIVLVASSSFIFDELFEDAKSNYDWLVDFRRDIHENPEIGLNTYRTRDQLVKELNKMGITPSEGWAYGPTSERETGAGLVFDLGTGEQPDVLLRGDMDGLPVVEENDLPFKSKIPGQMHACGHDAHTTMLLGAVKLLKEREAELNGTVRIMFQPGEEGARGGDYMVQEGVLTQQPAIQHAVALHVSADIPTGSFVSVPGTLMAGGQQFNITVHGKGGHAGSPFNTIDPVVIASSIIQELQHVVSRESIGGGSTSPYLLSVTLVQGGTSHNIIPDEVLMSGSARALSMSGIKNLNSRIAEVAEYTAKAHRANVTVWFDATNPPLDIDETTYNWLYDLQMEASPVFIEYPAGEFSYGMEDFSFVTNEVPSSFYFVGIASGISTNNNPPTNVELHSSGFALDETVLPRGAAFLAAAANTLLTALNSHSHFTE